MTGGENCSLFHAAADHGSMLFPGIGNVAAHENFSNIIPVAGNGIADHGVFFKNPLLIFQSSIGK